MRKKFENALTLVLVACALVVTVAVVRKEFAAPAGSPISDEPRRIDGWQELMGAGIWLGSTDAAIVVIEFADFQCPFCAVAARSLREIRSRSGEEVAVLYRHFPLDGIHPHATDAAIAAECAAAQGVFEAFHDLLFAEQEAIGSTEWTDFGERAGASSISEFSACLDASWPSDRVAEDLRAAQRAGLQWTPSVIVNGMLLPGTPDLEMLETHVSRALEERGSNTR